MMVHPSQYDDSTSLLCPKAIGDELGVDCTWIVSNDGEKRLQMGLSRQEKSNVTSNGLNTLPLPLSSLLAVSTSEDGL